jgi:exodeoxyribonuclease VII small subunit
MATLMASKQQPEFNFEEALEELERLVSSMEEGELSLEDSMTAFEKGIKLTRECQTALQKAEQKVQILLNESGETQAFDVKDED